MQIHESSKLILEFSKKFANYGLLAPKPILQITGTSSNSTTAQPEVEPRSEVISEERSVTYSLYRNSDLSRELRVHWASFDADDLPGYNLSNCQMAARLLNANIKRSSSGSMNSRSFLVAIRRLRRCLACDRIPSIPSLYILGRARGGRNLKRQTLAPEFKPSRHRRSRTGRPVR